MTVTSPEYKPTKYRPTGKVTKGALAGALVAVIIGSLNQWVFIENPITGEIGAGLTVVVTAVLQYFVKD